jgi:transcriptional regulator with XRE-family HTH domain
LRRLRGVTVEVLADEAELPASVIRRLEQGITKQPDQDTIRKLARVFGYSAGEFIDAVPNAVIKAPPIIERASGEGQRAGKRPRQAS